MKRRCIFFLLGGTSLLLGNPEDPVVIQGDALFHLDGPVLQVQAADRTVIDWTSFSIAQEETTCFVQPNSDASVLNRVTGLTPSLIEGVLEANGRVILVNPQGVIVSKTGVIRAQEFVAAPLDIVKREDFSLDLSPDGLDVSSFINMDGFVRAERIEERGGKIVLLGKEVTVRGTLEAQGGTIELAGPRIALEGDARIDASSASGGGVVHIGGSQSDLVFLGENARIDASAATKGDGGEAVLLSQGSLFCYGTVKAHGGSMQGNGGSVEISGLKYLDFRGKVDLSGGPDGKDGQLLFDPSTITIDNMGPTAPLLPVCPATGYDPVVASAVILDTDLAAHLAMCSITIQTTSGGGGTGDIVMLQGASVSWAAPNSLTLIADNQISIQGEFIASAVADISFSAPTIVVGDAANVLPATVQTDGAITLTAPTSFSAIGGAGGGVVTVKNGPGENLSLTAGSVTLQSITSGDNVTLGGSMTGPILIDVQTGNLLIDSDSSAIVSIDTNDFATVNVALDFVMTAAFSGNSSFLVDSMFGTGTTVDIGRDLICDATGGSTYVWNTQNSFLTANITRNMTLSNHSGTVAGFIPFGIGASIDVGGDLLVQNFSTGALQILSNQDLTVDVAGDVTVQSNGTANVFVGAVQNLQLSAGGDVTVQSTVVPTGLGPLFGAGIAVQIDAGNDVYLGHYGKILGGFPPSTGSVLVIADHSIIMDANSVIGGVTPLGGELNSVILVVDNAFPSSPQIGPGAFLMDSSAVIETGTKVAFPVQIFTARRSQNSVLGTINNSSFSAGLFNVDTDTEQWGQYYPQAFAGPLFTIFYKEQFSSATIAAITASSSQTVGTVYDLLQEFQIPIRSFDDEFCLISKVSNWAALLVEAPLVPPVSRGKKNTCSMIQMDNYRKFYPSLQRWGYLSQE